MQIQINPFTDRVNFALHLGAKLAVIAAIPPLVGLSLATSTVLIGTLAVGAMKCMALAGQETDGLKVESRRLSFPGYAASCLISQSTTFFS